MSEMTWLCGLYRFEENMPVFVILTREPGKDIAFIHDRMPVILGKESIKPWMDPQSNPAEIVKTALTDMYYEKAQ